MRHLLLPLTLVMATAAQAEPPNVVTDILPVHGLVSAVMGDLGQPSLLIEPGVSAHTSALKPSGARALQSATLIFRVGPELTPGLSSKIEALAPDARDVHLLNLEGTHHLAPREEVVFEDHGDDHEDHEDHGHDEHEHGDLDPHAWLNPDNAILWTQAISDELSALDPQNASVYAANAKSASLEIHAAAAEVMEALKPLRQRPYGVFHDAYQYFEVFFDTAAVGALMTLEAEAPSVARLQALQNALVEQGVVCLFIEPQFPDRLVQGLQTATGARIATLDPLGADIARGQDAYPALIRALGTSTSNCLTPSG